MGGSNGFHGPGAVNDRNDAHIWAVRLDEIDLFWPEWIAVLAADEVTKANRFVKPSDRFRSGASRAILRQILAQWCGLNPRDITFSYNHFGKPELATDQNVDRVGFNVSHSNEYVLIGVSGERSIGVDIEWLSRETAFSELASGICSASELSVLKALPEPLRLRELYRYWTLKEACVKAMGMGLSFPHSQIEVGRKDDVAGAANYLICGRDLWSVFSLDDIPGYVASVAVPGESVTLRRRVMVWPSPETG